MNKYLVILIGLLSLCAGSVTYADNEVGSTVNQSAVGSTSVARIVVPESRNGSLNITDIGYVGETANPTLTIESGVAVKPVTTAANAGAKTIAVDNSSGVFTTTGNCVYFNAAAGTYTFVTATNSSSTNISFVTAITPAQTVNDKLWKLGTAVVKPLATATTANSLACSLWLPGTVPNVFTLSLQTNSVLEVNGVRSNYK